MPARKRTHTGTPRWLRGNALRWPRRLRLFGAGLWFCFLWLPALAQKPLPPTLLTNPTELRQTYRDNLATLRLDHRNHRSLPDLRFFLFGMGNRLKLIYRNGRLLNALTGNIEEQWEVQREIIVPSEYTVHLELTHNAGSAPSTVQIREDQTGVWILQSGKRPRLISGTRSRLNLPRFANEPYGPVLRVLHQEVLINVIAGRPVPNFLVYSKPWYRDAALMAMVLRDTDNVASIRDWIMALRDPFDRNNHGITEADNIGQVLFLASLVSDKTHPVVQAALDSVKRFEQAKHIVGKTDYAEHPVFQTKWLKYGLKALGLPDPYVIPAQYDSYSSLFWYDYTDQHVTGNRFSEKDNEFYPYLVWAEDHFYRQAHRDASTKPEKHGMLGNLDYPLSWEQNASDAHYPSLTVLEKSLVKQKLAFPHTWHAAEMFLMLKQGKE